MATQDSYVQVAPDSTGKKIDNSQLTRADGTVVQRQRVVIGDDTDPAQQATVFGGDVYVRARDLQNVMEQILNELREIKEIAANFR